MKTTLTINRPNGTIEKVEMETPLGVTKTRFAAIVIATRNAGRGEVAGYENHFVKCAPIPSARVTNAALYMTTGTRREIEYNRKHIAEMGE